MLTLRFFRAARSVAAYRDGTGVHFVNDKELQIETGSQSCTFSIQDKFVHTNHHGGKIVAVSSTAEHSQDTPNWALATFDADCVSSAYFHGEGRITYYVTSGVANIVISDTSQRLKQGEHIVIEANQDIQVLKANADRGLEVLIKCTHAWSIAAMFLAEPADETNQASLFGY
jgi:quercetin dioxygenase-like cupin family protein